MANISVEEFRNWATLLIASVGGVVALWQFKTSQEQRKLENSFRMIELFKNSLEENDIKNWTWIFHAASNEHGADIGHFIDDGEQVSFDVFFTEGPPDEGTIERMAQLFDLIGYSVLKGDLELRVVYFELGQLMVTINRWLSGFTGYESNIPFLQEYYPSFHKMFQKHEKQFKKWRYKTYAHIG